MAASPVFAKDELQRLTRCFDMGADLRAIRDDLVKRKEQVRFELSFVRNLDEKTQMSSPFYEGVLAAIGALQKGFSGSKAPDDVQLLLFPDVKLFDLQQDGECKNARFSRNMIKMTGQANEIDLKSKTRFLVNGFEFSNPLTGLPEQLAIAIYHSQDGKSGMIRQQQVSYVVGSCPERAAIQYEKDGKKIRQFNGEGHWLVIESRYVWGSWDFTTTDGVPDVSDIRKAFHEIMGVFKEGEHYGFWSGGKADQELFCKDMEQFEKPIFVADESGQPRPLEVHGY